MKKENLPKRKAFNFFRSYYDVFKELPNNDSKVEFIQALLEKQFEFIEPEDLKGISKFAYISQKHSIDSQVNGFLQKMEGLTNKPPSQAPSQGVSIAPSVQEKGKGKEQVKEKEQGQLEIVPKNVFSFKKSLVDYGFNAKLVNDWLKVRKLKKAANTQTAFNGFIKELEKRSDFNINDLLTHIIEKSWSGFKWEWFDNSGAGNKNKPIQEQKNVVQEAFERGERAKEMIKKLYENE